MAKAKSIIIDEPAGSIGKDIPDENTQESVKKLPAKLTITVDNTIDEVIYSNQNGDILFFDPHPGKFLELPEKVVKALTFGNAASYWTALGQNKILLSEREYPPSKELSITPKFADPKTQMDVSGMDPEYKYCWSRPDQKDTMERKGYVLARDRDIAGFNRLPDGTLIIGSAGKIEMFLMKTPMANYKNLQSRSDELSRWNNEGIEEQAAETIHQLGGTARELPKPNPSENVLHMRDGFPVE